MQPLVRRHRWAWGRRRTAGVIRQAFAYKTNPALDYTCDTNGRSLPPSSPHSSTQHVCQAEVAGRHAPMIWQGGNARRGTRVPTLGLVYEVDEAQVIAIL